MKRMKRCLMERIDVLLMSILAFLGITSSYGQRPHPRVEVKYGVPAAEYAISGKITGDDNKPVAGAEVVVVKENAPNDTVRTDKHGRFSNISSEHFPSDSVSIIINDPSGYYQSDTLQVALSYQKNGDVWNRKAKAKVNHRLTKNAEKDIKVERYLRPDPHHVVCKYGVPIPPTKIVEEPQQNPDK